MRKVSKTDQEKREIEESERTDRRKGGFELMKVRDRGYFTMSNGVGILWHTDRELDEGEARRYIKDGSFVLNIEGKEAVFDKEEFMRYLRWV